LVDYGHLSSIDCSSDLCCSAGQGNFADYVQETANQLFRSYKTNAAAISLIIQTDEIMLPIGTAIPCGLLLNELITNALKYAFLGGRKGDIKIEMQLVEKIE
jgi:two-component sensor histidine kinase